MRSIGMRVSFVMASALAVNSLGCNWNDFDDIKDQASIKVYDTPADYRKSKYGSVLTTLRTDVGKPTEASRIIISAGADSPVVFETVWAGDKFSGSSSTRCKKKSQCSKGGGSGSTLIPFPLWGASTPMPQRACVLTPGLPNAYVYCETNTSASNNYPLNLSNIYTAGDKTTIRFSGAGLPESYPLGVALIGVHVVRNLDRMPERGTLFFQPDLKGTVEGNVPPNQRLDFIDPTTQDVFANGVEAGDYGSAVAAQLIAGNKLLIAVSQPSKNRVIVGEYDPSIMVPDSLSPEPDIQASYRAHTLACVKSPDEKLVGFGKVLTLGDIDNDGHPELFVGIDPNDGKNGAKQRVYMYPGKGLPAYDADADVCPLWEMDPVQVGCRGGIRGVECEDTGFGTALAVGDVDGDKYGDLIVGAPRADVQGTKEAGVVWVIPGTSTGGLDFDRMTNLYASGQESSGLLGSTVGAVHTRGRDEPVAGAPGADLVYMFMCSKLEGEKPTTMCLPKK
jgi:hypothetical protein